MAKSIQIFTSSNLCRNPRVVKEATTLAAAGYRVRIVLLSLASRFDELDQELTASSAWEGIVIDRVGANGSTGLPARAATWLARKALRRWGVETYRALGPYPGLLRAAISHDADLTICHTEVPICAVSELMRRGRRVAVDFEDWHSEDLLPENRRNRPLALLRKAEEFALRHCDYVSTTSGALANALSAANGGRPVRVIRNTFPLPPETATGRAASHEVPQLVWVSQTTGPGRGLEEFLRAWSRVDVASQLTMIGQVHDGYRQELSGLVPPHRRGDIQFVPPVPPGSLPARLAEFDIGLALERPFPRNRDLTISNKIFHYLSAGLAVIATNTQGHSEVMAAAPGAGRLITLDDEAKLVATLRQLLTTGPALREMQVAARQAAAKLFSWEHDAATLLDAVARVLSTRAQPA